MFKLLSKILLLLLASSSFAANAKWLSLDNPSINEPNKWVAFRKDFNLDKVPVNAKAKIAVDSKYWLWINGELAVFEGGTQTRSKQNRRVFR